MTKLIVVACNRRGSAHILDFVKHHKKTAYRLASNIAVISEDDIDFALAEVKNNNSSIMRADFISDGMLVKMLEQRWKAEEEGKEK